MILGLDVSTTVCGWAIIDRNGKNVGIGYHRFAKDVDLYYKISEFRMVIDEAIYEYCGAYPNQIHQIYIEEPVKMYGASTAHVISLLQRFNGMVSATLAIDHGINPVLINALHARSVVGLKVPRGIKKVEGKKAILQHVRDTGLVSENNWQYKKTGQPQDHCFDMADAFVIAYAGYLNESNRISAKATGSVKGDGAGNSVHLPVLSASQA